MPNLNPHVVLMGSYAAANKAGVYAFAFDENTGALTQLAAHTGIERPSWLIAHPNKHWVYAVSEMAVASNGKPGEVWALDYDSDARTFRALNHQSSQGDWPCHLAIDGTGKWIFAANYGTGSMTVFPLRDDGSLGEASDHVQHEGHGPDEKRQEGPHAHSTTLTPDNQFAIVADLGLDRLVVYAFDASNGKLREHARVATRPGAGPRHLAFHPNGRVLYAANELANTIAAYAYDAAAGALTELQVLDTIPRGAPENTVGDIHVSAKGDRVYVSNRGDDSVAVFAADDAGTLTRVAIVPSGGKTPRNFALAPGGTFILVANQDSGSVVVMTLRNGSNEVGRNVSRAAIPGASCIQYVN